MVSTELTEQHRGQELKKKLLQCLQDSNKQLSEAAQFFLDKSNQNEAEKIALLQAVIRASDHVLQSGDWQSSLFLKNTVKTVEKIKQEAEMELARHYEHARSSVIQAAELGEDEVEVYISLFQSDGHNMEKWAVQLRSLERYVVGRPVYQQADDIEKRIRLRNAAANEAYVIVNVKKMDIQSGPLQLKDQYGHVLLQLKDSALKRGKIIGFVHQGKRYHFSDGKLVS